MALIPFVTPASSTALAAEIAARKAAAGSLVATSAPLALSNAALTGLLALAPAVDATAWAIGDRYRFRGQIRGADAATAAGDDLRTSTINVTLRKSSAVLLVAEDVTLSDDTLDPAYGPDANGQFRIVQPSLDITGLVATLSCAVAATTLAPVAPSVWFRFSGTLTLVAG